MKFFITLFFFILLATSLLAQSTVSGRITDTKGEPLVGAVVAVKGTPTSTSSDYDGNYTITVSDTKSLLSFFLVGYISQEISINNRSVLDVVMQEDTQVLGEVVVVGYGTAKAKDLTAPIAIVKSDEITKMSTASAMSAIQGKVAGVQIINSGTPGEAPKVRIRGEGGFDDSRIGPLYVVDGMFYDNINFLNQNDIETLSILKDASAAAIYGVRAANGVVLIETKKGARNRPATVTFDSYFGIQKVTNMVKMANSAEYAQVMKERGTMTSIEESIKKWGESASGVPKANTNWYDEMLRDAVIQNYNLTISGGGEKTSYSVGGSYFNQDGIMDIDNYFRRITGKAQGEYQAFKWLKLGTNVMITNSKVITPNNGAWSHAYSNPSIMPIEDASLSDDVSFPRKFVSPNQIGLSTTNPYADMYYGSDKKSKGFQVLPNIYAQINFMEDNKFFFKTALSQSLSFNEYRHMKPEHRLNGANKDSELIKGTDLFYNYIWDNTLTFSESIEKHSFTLMGGHSMRSENWRQLEGTARNVLYGKDEYYYLSNGDPSGRTIEDDGYTYNGLSFFGRATYDYDGRYLLSATIRQDGSSKYQQKTSVFPSVGLGWVLSRENFMEDMKAIDFLKIRGSWGKLGNDKIPASDGFKSTKTGLTYSGYFGDGIYPGIVTVKNFTYLSWEEVDEIDLGLDITMLSNRLTFEFDYYKRVTKNATIMRSYYADSNQSLVNGGEIENKGLEFSLSWNDKIGNFRYGANANLTTLKNKVLKLGGMSYMTDGAINSRISRPGDPLLSFYGLKTNGIYQTQAEIDADPLTQGNDVEPGDFRFVDQNGDDKIDASDRVIIGSHLPDVIYGLNLNLGYKNFDLSVMLQGQTGAELLNQKRAVYRFAADPNFDKDLFDNRWTKQGDNKYPSAKGMVKPWNIDPVSDYYIEDASFFRIQNIQLAYTFDSKQLSMFNLKSLRLSLSADRPLTIFKSNSFTPEVSGGWDDQVYPLAATYSFGIRITY